jgi:hypothetical protein
MNNILKLTLLINLILFQSCSKEEEDLVSQKCQSDCTEIIGKIMTENGTVPITNLELTVKWDNIPYLGIGKILTKATTQTDSEGNFHLKFFMRDHELEEGDLRIEYKVNENEYLAAHLDKIRFKKVSQDTIITLNYNIPKKAFLNLSLLNLKNIKQKDWFILGLTYEKPVGFEQSIYKGSKGWNSESNKNDIIEIPGNQSVELRITRGKNNVSTIEIDTIFLNTGATSNYLIDFNN